MAFGKWLSVLIAVALCAAIQGAEWGYEDDAAANWGEEFATCEGTKQSPIDIEDDDTMVDGTLGDFTLSGYDDTTSTWSIMNNGHTIVINGATSGILSGGGLSGTYNLQQFHIHFGDTDFDGSEHTFNGYQFPMELHFVHYASSFADLSAAVASGEGDALAVLGVMYQIGETESVLINKIIENFETVQYKADAADITAFNLLDLMPQNVSYFARYEGGLTSPTCNEVVAWTVFNNPVSMTQAQFDKLREEVYENAEDDTEHEELLAGNWRPTQSLSGRTVKVTHTWEGPASGARGLAASLATGVMAALLAVWRI